MNGVFENSRGLRDLAKHARIADLIRNHRLDFVGISETGKRDFSVSLLNRVSGGVEFTWKSRPPHRKSGGILLGIRTETMDVLASSEGEFHIKFHIRKKPTTSHGVLLLCMAPPRMNRSLLSSESWLT